MQTGLMTLVETKSILENHASAATQMIGENGDTLLHIAVETGHNYFLETLLKFLEDGNIKCCQTYHLAKILLLRHISFIDVDTSYHTNLAALNNIRQKLIVGFSLLFHHDVLHNSVEAVFRVVDSCKNACCKWLEKILIIVLAAITVPGGSNQETGVPLFQKEMALAVFAFTNKVDFGSFLIIPLYNCNDCSLWCNFVPRDLRYKTACLPIFVIVAIKLPLLVDFNSSDLHISPSLKFNVPSLTGAVCLPLNGSEWKEPLNRSEVRRCLTAASPLSESKGDLLQVKVNKLSSTKTQIPYDYYYLNYCKPEQILNTDESIGEVLNGDRIHNSVYMFDMREDIPCKVSCRVKLDAKSTKRFKEMIDDEYRVNMILDNLPAAVVRQSYDEDNAGSESTTYEHGFHVGAKGYYAGMKDAIYIIRNHLSFKVIYHKNLDNKTARIVGFEVIPVSIKHEYKEWVDWNPQLTTCNKTTEDVVLGSSGPQTVDTDNEIVFTYDVTFKESDIKWTSRWDAYLVKNDDSVHWFSIINSLIIILFLSGMLAMIMMRTLYKDISNLNQLDPQDESKEETGWKVVHGDVFRAPVNSELLSVFVGSGVQIFGMTLVTMILALLGFISPSNRGSVITLTFLIWVFMGLFAGFSSACVYKSLKGIEWEKTTFKTSFMFPGISFVIFFVLNALVWGENSFGIVSFGTMFVLVSLWLWISAPLVFIGAYLGFKKPVIDNPVKTNKIPRQVPEQPWYKKPVFTILVGGILPFVVIYVELFFVLTSVWFNQFYYIVGFICIAFVILIITCAEIAIVLCYFQLCNEDYNWWWLAYLTTGRLMQRRNTKGMITNEGRSVSFNVTSKHCHRLLTSHTPLHPTQSGAIAPMCFFIR
ncbi:hypothetical protein QVD17_02672 [Tagetes erecta]|uniref:Transmembrane 9 superfamily member n=1 Tax=Tagetes erecta TaxID=13708 RepID=A0AAD8L9N0_TARER|nr:hypothetical protein QVD17_02672 [Tagetes erecta]